MANIFEGVPLFSTWRERRDVMRLAWRFVLLALVVLLLLVSSCAMFKKATRTALDVAHEACLIFGEENAEALAPELGVDVGDVAQSYCDHEANVRPFVEHLLAAQRESAQSAGIAVE